MVGCDFRDHIPCQRHHGADLGALADKKSRKLMALRAGFCLAITYFLGGLVTNPWELLGVRFIQGLSAGLWPALLAIISVESPKLKLGFCMGVMRAV